MVLLVIGVAALGFNLRGAITSLPPVFPELAGRLRLSAAAVSLLAAAPVICFGVVSGFAAWLSRRAGEERVLLVALVALTVGLTARGVAPGALLFPGTVLASAAIAVMNVLLGSLIKRRWPERAGFLVGLYITALSVGAIVGSLVSVPLYRASARSVPLTLGWLAAPAALAVLLWLPQARRHPQESSRERCGTHPADPPGSPVVSAMPGGSRRRASLFRHALAWHVTLFMGLQSLLYYAALSWLPTIFRDRGEPAGTAGDLLAVMGAGSLAISLFIPVLAQRMRTQYALVVPTVAGIAAGLAGALYAPLGSEVIWMLILGAAQNAALGIAIYFTVARAPDPATAASLSAMAQAVGYLLASAGPLEVGLIHSATGSWNLPVAVLLALTAGLLVFGLLAARPMVLPSNRPPRSACVVADPPGKAVTPREGRSPVPSAACPMTPFPGDPPGPQDGCTGHASA